jgi:hypothetical protein
MSTVQSTKKRRFETGSLVSDQQTTPLSSQEVVLKHPQLFPTHILAYLDLCQVLAAVSSVSKQWREATLSPVLFRTLYWNRLPWPEDDVEEDEEDDNDDPILTDAKDEKNMVGQETNLTSIMMTNERAWIQRLSLTTEIRGADIVTFAQHVPLDRMGHFLPMLRHLSLEGGFGRLLLLSTFLRGTLNNLCQLAILDLTRLDCFNPYLETVVKRDPRVLFPRRFYRFVPCNGLQCSNNDHRFYFCRVCLAPIMDPGHTNIPLCPLLCGDDDEQQSSSPKEEKGRTATKRQQVQHCVLCNLTLCDKCGIRPPLANMCSTSINNSGCLLTESFPHVCLTSGPMCPGCHRDTPKLQMFSCNVCDFGQLTTLNPTCATSSSSTSVQSFSMSSTLAGISVLADQTENTSSECGPPTVRKQYCVSCHRSCTICNVQACRVHFQHI